MVTSKKTGCGRQKARLLDRHHRTDPQGCLGGCAGDCLLLPPCRSPVQAQETRNLPEKQRLAEENSEADKKWRGECEEEPSDALPVNSSLDEKLATNVSHKRMSSEPVLLWHRAGRLQLLERGDSLRARGVSTGTAQYPFAKELAWRRLWR